MTGESREPAREAIKRFESGRTDREEFLDARGARTRLIRDQDDPRFFRMESETGGQEWVVTMTGLRLEGAGRPPRDYPREVPFLPHSTAVVMLMTISGSTVIRWEEPPHPSEAFADVREQLEDTGWETVEEAGRKAVFEKAGVTRTLILFPGEERTDLVLTEERSRE
jgi:hypothetical protein